VIFQTFRFEINVKMCQAVKTNGLLLLKPVKDLELLIAHSSANLILFSCTNTYCGTVYC